jgi:hypothetical protein
MHMHTSYLKIERIETMNSKEKLGRNFKSQQTQLMIKLLQKKK